MLAFIIFIITRFSDLKLCSQFVSELSTIRNMESVLNLSARVFLLVEYECNNIWLLLLSCDLE